MVVEERGVCGLPACEPLQVAQVAAVVAAAVRLLLIPAAPSPSTALCCIGGATTGVIGGVGAAYGVCAPPHVGGSLVRGAVLAREGCGVGSGSSCRGCAQVGGVRGGGRKVCAAVGGGAGVGARAGRAAVCVCECVCVCVCVRAHAHAPASVTSNRALQH
eukprot:732728-Pelagomonas_calceolata.AAC.6